MIALCFLSLPQAFCSSQRTELVLKSKIDFFINLLVASSSLDQIKINKINEIVLLEDIEKDYYSNEEKTAISCASIILTMSPNSKEIEAMGLLAAAIGEKKNELQIRKKLAPTIDNLANVINSSSGSSYETVINNLTFQFFKLNNTYFDNYNALIKLLNKRCI